MNPPCRLEIPVPLGQGRRENGRGKEVEEERERERERESLRLVSSRRKGWDAVEMLCWRNVKS